MKRRLAPTTALITGVVSLLALFAPGVGAAEVLLEEVDVGLDFVNLSGSHTRKLFIVEQLGGGGALFDHDGDGDLDLYLVNGADLAIHRGEKPPVHNAFYRNDGPGPDGRPRFVDVTAAAGVGDTRWGIGATVGDADGDGDDDLYVTNFGPNVLYENRGDGTFRDVTATAGVGDPGMGVSAAFGDVDGDGDLDLYVVNYLVLDLDDPPQGGRPCLYEGIETACGPIGLPTAADVFYENLGPGPDGSPRFRSAAKAFGLVPAENQYGLGVVMGDLDDDGLQDIVVANDSGPNFLFHNRGKEPNGPRFENFAGMAGVDTQADGRFQAGMGIDLGDVDGDLRPDLFITNFSNDHNTLYKNHGELLFLDVSYPSGLGGPSRIQMAWGTRFVDVDQDGDLDLYIANGHIYPEVDADGREGYRQADQLFLNDGSGRYREASGSVGRLRDAQVSRGLATGDLDGDLDVDLVVFEMGSSPTVLESVGAAGASLLVDVRNSAGAPAIGARVEVTADERRQRREVRASGSYAAASDVRAHFGLAGAETVDRLEIRWPDELHRVITGLAAGRQVVLVP